MVAPINRDDVPEYKKQYLLSKFADNFYYYFFIIHFFISVFVDSCGVIGIENMYTKNIIEKYISSYNDYLLFERPTWFKNLIYLEIFTQIPMFLWFFTMFNRFYDELNKQTFTEEVTKQNKARIHEWRKFIRFFLKIYGLMASASTAYCIYEIYLNGHYPGTAMPLDLNDRLKLISMYAPMVYIPGGLLFL
ncbi:hypothetical protein ACO0QE_003042 [Hanseniaspora vineae]